MPRRSSAALSRLPVTGGDPFESIESRRRRLLPQSEQPPPAPPPPPAQSVRIPEAASAHSTAARMPNRADAPVLHTSRRGSKAKAAAAIRDADPELLVQELVADRHAASGTATAASLLRGWDHYHVLSHRHLPEPPSTYPVTADSIIRVGSLFKKAGYRSFPNYMSAAKARHIEGPPAAEWTQLHEHTGKWVSRSVLRGIGPSRQSCPFHFKRLCGLTKQTTPLVDGGPMQPMHLALLSTLFLLREVEAGTAKVSAWSFDHADLEISWNLPGSKTDPVALGTSRTWGCLCELRDFACPYHLAVEHSQWLLEHPTLRSDGDAPLFPTACGNHPLKTKVVDTFERLASLCNQPLTSLDGLRLFGGHSARVTGAQTFALAGLEVNKIRILARHSGDTILRYVADVPLRTLRADLGIGGSSSSTPSLTMGPGAKAAGVTQLRARLSSLEEQMTKMENAIQSQSQDLIGVAARFIETAPRVYLQNTESSAIHLVSSEGRTACGWKFARSRTSTITLATLSGVPGILMCEACLPSERIIAMTLGPAPLSDDD